MFLVLVSSRSSTPPDVLGCCQAEICLVETQPRSHGNLLNKVDESFCFLVRSPFQLLSP